MELRQYLLLLKKWAWLLVLTTLVAAGASYGVSRLLPPTYRAETTVLVGRILDNPNGAQTDVQNPADMAQAYVLLATQPPVLQATAEAVHWPDSWQTLFFKITALNTGNQLVKITVVDNDPLMAKLIADEIAHQLVVQGPVSSRQKQAEDQQAFVSSQLTQLKLQIEASQKTLNALTSQAALETDPVKLTDLNTRVTALQTKIADWQKNYASLSALLNNASSLYVTVLAAAILPTAPVSPNIPRNVLFAALAGLALAGGAILLLEYLDDTVKGADDIQRVMGLTMLGAISRIGGVHKPLDNLITLKHPRSPIAEAYRVLRTNLRFTGIENTSGALLVTSTNPSEGKTTTAANLAVILAQAGRRVILVDTDLRRPNINCLFELDNNVGLSSLFLGEGYSLEGVLQPTPVEGLSIISSGPLPPNPAELLDSPGMADIIVKLRAQCDMLILDSPPVLPVADASILGSHCSGVIIVVDAGRTRTDACRRTVDTLQKTGARIYGVVLNRLNTGRSSGYYNESDYGSYYASQEQPSGRNGQRSSRKQVVPKAS